MAKGMQFLFPGFGRRRPVPFKFLKPSGQNGPVKITKPAKKDES